MTGRFYREALTRNPITSPSQMLIPRNVVKNVGPMITGHHESEDWDYTLRIALRYPITMHEHELVVYRLHADSRSGSRSARQFLYADWDLRVFARNEASSGEPAVRPSGTTRPTRTITDAGRIRARPAGFSGGSSGGRRPSPSWL